MAKKASSSGKGKAAGKATMPSAKSTLPSKPQVSKYQGYEKKRISRSDIKNAPYNPRQMSAGARKRLKRGIEKFKLVNSLVWNARTGNLVGGHQRINILDDLEGNQDYLIDIDKIDVDLATEKKLNVLLNNPNAQGQFDASMLEDLVAGLKIDGEDVHDTGFTTGDFHKMFGDAFLEGEFKDQADAEADDIAALESMREIGVAEDKARANAKEGGSAVAVSESGSGDGGSESDGGSGSSSNDSEAGTSSGPVDGAVIGDANASDTDDQEEGRDDTKQKMYERRQKFIEQQVGEHSNDDVTVTVVFHGDKDLLAFLGRLDLDATKRYFDAFEFAEAINLDWPPASDGE